MILKLRNNVCLDEEDGDSDELQTYTIGIQEGELTGLGSRLDIKVRQ